MNEKEADQVLQRVAVLALLHDPEAAATDPTYSLAADINWALDPVHDIGDASRQGLVELVARVILDPTGSRRDLVAALHL